MLHAPDLCLCNVVYVLRLQRQMALEQWVTLEQQLQTDLEHRDVDLHRLIAQSTAVMRCGSIGSIECLPAKARS